MATSGTVTFRSNRDEIIKGALRIVGGYDPENSSGPTSTQISVAALMLNGLVKLWAADGLHLWERKYAVVFPQKGQSVYVLGSPGPAGDHATLSTPLTSGFIQTTLASAGASGDSTLTVTAITGGLSTTGNSGVTMTSGYNIGIELDSGSVQWTTLSATPSTTSINITTPLTGAAASGNNVWVYQTKLQRPLRVMDAFVRSVSGGNDSPVRIITRDEYNRFGLKSATGVPSQLYYDRRSTSGHLYLFPAFSDVDRVLYLECAMTIEDFSSSSDDYDLPQEWELALKYNLALLLAPEYEVPEEKFKQIEKLATATFNIVSGFDRDVPGSVQFGIDRF